MKKWIVLILTGFLFAANAFSQRDTILDLSDLKFHSPLEKASFIHFTQQKTDTLNAFLAVNELLSEEDRVYLERRFENLYQELVSRRI